jgi:hypothetical protein
MKMLPQKVKSQTNELCRRLLDHGWEVTVTEQPFEDEWWCAQFWVIESVWSHQGVSVYLSFLVDPMSGPDTIWAVHASRERPRQRPLDENPLMSLGHAWQKKLRAFLASLDRFRTNSS